MQLEVNMRCRIVCHTYLENHTIKTFLGTICVCGGTFDKLLIILLVMTMQFQELAVPSYCKRVLPILGIAYSHES